MSDRMVLTEIVYAFVWVNAQEAAEGAGLLADG